MFLSPLLKIRESIRDDKKNKKQEENRTRGGKGWDNSVHITLCSTSHEGAICYFVTGVCFAWKQNHLSAQM